MVDLTLALFIDPSSVPKGRQTAAALMINKAPYCGTHMARSLIVVVVDAAKRNGERIL